MRSVLFSNARVFDGSGAEPFDGHVLVRGNRIESVSATPIAAPDAELIECAGATLMPGLIEPHSHLSFLDHANPHEFSSMPVEVPELADQCDLLNGLAKTYPKTGWR
jgi:imidazolonepropionase-like amidohydrolase